MNKKMKHILQLNRSSKERKSSGEFVVEGKKMFIEAPKNWIRGIYVSESFLFKEEHKQLLKEMSYEVVLDEVFHKISDTMTPQGILCILSKPEYQMEDLGNHKDNLILVLEDLQDPGNLGTILRTAEGAGVNGIILTYKSVDVFNPKVIRATMGSIYRVPFIYVENIKEELQTLQKNEYKVFAADLEGAMDYDKVSYQGKTIFLVGNEGNGLKKETSKLADVKIKIPMLGKVESLNAAMATGLLIYEALKQRREK
jgi:TrmH family RNA methyltransferase